MPVLSAAVGSEIGPYEEELTTRKILAYSAGLGETSNIYFDDSRPDGIFAHPMMVMPLEWPVSRDLRDMPAFGVTIEEQRRVVHAEQDTEILRPIQPGIRVISKGRLVAAKRIKPGTMTVSRLTLESEDGRLLSTSYSTAIYREVALQGEDTIEQLPPDWPQKETTTSWKEAIIPIPRELPHIYTECANLWNPIHTEREVALAAGLPDIILHGTCTLALAMKEVIANKPKHGPHDVGPVKLKRFAGRFSGMVIPGSSIRVRHATMSEGSEFEVVNVDGKLAISRGRAIFGN